MGKTYIDITNKQQIFIDANGNKYDSFQQLRQSKKDNNKGVVGSAGEDKK